VAAPELIPEAAEEAAVAGLGIAGAAELIGCLILFGLMYVWKWTLGGVLSILADAFIKFNVKVWKFSSGHPLRWIGHKIDEINDSVYRGLGHAAAGMHKSAINTFEAAGALQVWIAKEVQQMAEDWWQGVQDIANVWIPQARDDAIHWARQHGANLAAQLAAVKHWTTKEIQRALRGARVETLRELQKVRQWTVRRIQTETRPITRTLRRLRTEVTRVEQNIAREAQRLNRIEHAIGSRVDRLQDLLRRQGQRADQRLERLEQEMRRINLGTVSAIGVVALLAALAKAGLGFLSCRNVKTAGKATCALPTDALEDLLAVGGLIGGSVSLIAFAREMENVVESMDSVVQFFWEV
jgi:hypothetical protein